MNYRDPADFTGQRVIVVEGNSAPRSQTDLTLDGHVETTWVSRRPPQFLPDDLDGRALFDVATARRRTLDTGHGDSGGVALLGDTWSYHRSVPPAAASSSGMMPPPKTTMSDAYSCWSSFTTSVNAVV